MSKTHANSSIFSLPQEIIFNILSRLPTKSLVRFRCVCTSSAPLISHPSFTKLHLNSTVADNNHRAIVYYECTTDHNHTNRLYSLRSPLTFHETLKLQSPSYPRNCGTKRFAGSNKGLICLFDSSFHSCSGTLLLWNPSINKHKILDGPHNIINDKFSLFVFGFGFVSRTCEFKVVGIVYDYEANENNDTEPKGGCSCCAVYPVVDTNNTVSVYSLSTNSWDKKEGASAPCYLTRGWSTPTFVNGFVNWLAYKEDGSHVIMSFDLDNERFQVYDLPKDIVPDYHDLSMISFGEEGSLSLSLSLCARYCEPIEKWDVWVMGEYGVVDSWKKVFAITNDLLSFPPLLMKNKREILVVMDAGRLKLFDAIKNEMQDLQTRGTPAFFQAIDYTASLALLDG